MSSSFEIISIESSASYTLYHLDAPKHGMTTIVFFRGDPFDLEPTLASLAHLRLRFDFEIEPQTTVDTGDPRLRHACRIRALTLRAR